MAIYTGNHASGWSTLAAFQSWAQFWESALGVGWVRTADTGQTNAAALAIPPAINTIMGYQIWRMADALQATHPIFLKIEFGSGTSVNNVGLWLTVGTGTDGAGTITGVLRARYSIIATANTAITSASYASAAGSRFVGVVSTAATGQSTIIWFSIERTVDNSGSYNSDGIIMYSGSQAAPGAAISAYIPYTGTAPGAESGFHYLLSNNNPTLHGLNVGVSLFVPMSGYAMQPGINLLATRAADFANYAVITCPVYGVTRTYQHVGPNVTLPRGATNSDPTSRLAILYE